MTITVTAVNDAPVAANDAATTAEDTAVSGNVLGNDTDVDPGTTLTATLGASPANGSVTLASNGSFTYTPDPNFNGADAFTYTASDGTAGSNVATVTITVTSVNDAPVAANDTATTTEETAVSGSVLGNDTDVDGGSGLAATLGASPSNGTVTLASDGTFTYTPAANFHGTDSFTYTASDGAAVSNLATVTITVTPVNDAPMAVNDTVTTEEDTEVTIAVLANDIDLEGDGLSVTGVGMAAHGFADLDGEGAIRYLPERDYSGTDSFTYTIGDGYGGSATATVNMTITPVVDNPMGVDDLATTLEDTPVTIAVLANDRDGDGDALSVESSDAPADGTVVVNANGTITFTPAANFNGLVEFIYTISDGYGGTGTAFVSITVLPVNDGPIAVDDEATTTEETAVIVPVLDNDFDPDGDTLSVSAVTAPQHGTVSANADGTLTYVPEANYQGPDGFSYTVLTGSVMLAWDASPEPDVTGYRIHYGSEPGLYTSVVDVGTALSGVVHGLVAGRQYYFAACAYNTSGVAGPFSTEVSYVVENVPDGRLETTATATVAITVTGANDAPEAVNDVATTTEETAVSGTVLGNDTDVDAGMTLTATLGASPTNGTVTLASDGRFTYTPNANYNGIDSFTYTASDGIAVSNVATVTITVEAVNDAPVAANDTATTAEETAVSGSVLGNDTDVDPGTTLTATLGVSPANGTVTLASDGSFTYTPNANFNGTDSFTYTASDGTTVSNAATVTITVNATNDAPVAVSDLATTAEETAVSGTVLGNDTDVDPGTTLTATLGASPTHGTVTLSAGGSFTYTPNANYHGTDSFTYTASDGTAASNVATVTVTITPINDGPVAVNETSTTPEDTAVKIAVLANDTDLDGDTLSVTSIIGPAFGTAVVNPDGTITYTPSLDYSGGDIFIYSLSDGHGGSASAFVIVMVTDVNDAPVAVNDAVSTMEGTAVSGTVLANDTDSDDRTLIVTLGASPTHGTVMLVWNGSFTYTPNADFNGTDSFTYTASDGLAVSNVATVTIAVTPVNDAPVAVNDAATTTEETAVSGTVLTNDTDVDAGTTLTATLGTSPTHGTAALASDGSFTYTPALNFNGTDSFTYTASDGTAASNVATVTITVTGVNDAPLAANDAAATTEDAPVNGSVLGNDTDVDAGTTLTATLGSSPTNGTVTLASGGSFTYTPNANFNGTDSFTYTASDGTAVSNVATVTITVNAVNDAPVAANDTASTAEETAVSGSVLTNDTDVDAGTTLTATLGASPANGTVTLASDGGFTYTPGRQLQRDGHLHLHGERRHGRLERRDSDDHGHGRERRAGGGERRGCHDGRDGGQRQRARERHGRRRQHDADGHARDEPDEWHADPGVGRQLHLHAGRQLQRDGQLHLHGERRDSGLERRDGVDHGGRGQRRAGRGERYGVDRGRDRGQRQRADERHRRGCRHDPDRHARCEPGERDPDAGAGRQLHLHAGGELQRDGQLHLHGERRHGGLERRDGDDHGHAASTTRRWRRTTRLPTTEETRGQRQRAGQRHGRRRQHDADRHARRRARRTAPLTLASDGSFTYTPAANFNGTDSFTYTASDGDGGLERRDGDDHGATRSTTRRWRRTTRRRRRKRRGGQRQRPGERHGRGCRHDADGYARREPGQRHRDAGVGRQLHVYAERQLQRDGQLHLHGERRHAASNVATVTITVTARERRAGGGERRGCRRRKRRRSAAACWATTRTSTAARR